ncbi:MAG: Ig-like domain-containing protein, partial [Candidatus Methanomethylophilaceae archaeon]|nr:Ig-like domain-containing protein [Candidatus Methanomethylophilaceae archaeon]
ELERTTLSVMSGDDIQLGFAVTPFDSSDDVVWTSSDESVVSITNDGIVAVKSGVATLTVTAGNQSASCEIVVSAPAVGDEQDNDNSVSITIGACVGALVLIGIASVLIYRRF